MSVSCFLPFPTFPSCPPSIQLAFSLLFLMPTSPSISERKSRKKRSRKEESSQCKVLSKIHNPVSLCLSHLFKVLEDMNILSFLFPYRASVLCLDSVSSLLFHYKRRSYGAGPFSRAWKFQSIQYLFMNRKVNLACRFNSFPLCGFAVPSVPGQWFQVCLLRLWIPRDKQSLSNVSFSWLLTCPASSAPPHSENYQVTK